MLSLMFSPWRNTGLHVQEVDKSKGDSLSVGTVMTAV